MIQNGLSFFVACPLQCTPGFEVNSNCSQCVPTHVCLTDNPCQNGATCIIGPTIMEYNCLCTYKHTGENCEGMLDLYLLHILHLHSTLKMNEINDTVAIRLLAICTCIRSYVG